MKAPLLFSALLLMPLVASGQTFDTSNFFTPAFTARPIEAPGLVALSANTTANTGSQSGTNIAWTHSAGGLVQARTNIIVADLDVQLAANTRTTGSSLVFGRRLTAEASLLGNPVLNQNGALNGLVTQVVGLGVGNNWSSTATLSGLAIVPDQLYQASFNVATGAGLPVGLLSSANFGILTPGVTDASNQTSQLLNLLGVVTVGTAPDTDTVTLVFKSATALNSLQFGFSAQSLLDVNALGGVAGNQDILTFSNLQITAVPEPGAPAIAMISCVGALFLFRRRSA